VGEFIDVFDLIEAKKGGLHKLTAKERKAVNASFRKGGLDGNTVFRSPNEGVSVAAEVMEKHGFEFMASGGFRPKNNGRTNYDFDRSNKADAFSPAYIENSSIWFSWYQHREGAFECLAYLS